MLFGKRKNPQDGLIFSPASGQVVPITQVPDPVFSEKVLGDGAAVILESGQIVSPVHGILVSIADTRHAYGIEGADGLQLLVHIGINTVELNGSGFDCKVKEGQKLKPGDVMCEVDISLLKQHGYPLHTPVLITNPEDFSHIEIKSAHASGSDTVIIEYKK